MAAEHGYKNNVIILLQQGASMLVRDVNGMTPSDLADKAGHNDCISILKEAAGECIIVIYKKTMAAVER